MTPGHSFGLATRARLGGAWSPLIGCPVGWYAMRQVIDANKLPERWPAKIILDEDEELVVAGASQIVAGMRLPLASHQA